MAYEPDKLHSKDRGWGRWVWLLLAALAMVAAAWVTRTTQLPEMQRIKLNDIMMQMSRYARERGRYPPSLADYNASDYAKWATLKAVDDLWGNPYHYWASPDGQQAMIWSCGPSGIDRHGAGDNIIFRFVGAASTTTPTTTWPS